MDSTGRGKKNCGHVGLDLDKMFQRAQLKDFKPFAIADSPEGPRSEPVETVRLEKCSGDAAGYGCRARQEAVLYTAHYDHLGIDPSLPGDKIYNGANDNATGCGILLELARVWAAMPVAAPQSILFASVTAEEQGLLGSEYLGTHSPVPPGKNYDGLEFRRCAAAGDAGGSRSQWRGAHHVYPVVAGDRAGFSPGDPSRPPPGGRTLLPLGSFQLGPCGECRRFRSMRASSTRAIRREWGEEQAKDFTEHRYHQPSERVQSRHGFYRRRGHRQVRLRAWIEGGMAADARRLDAWRRIRGSAGEKNDQ